MNEKAVNLIPASLSSSRKTFLCFSQDALESQAKPDFRYNPDISYDRQETYSSSRLWDVDDNSRRSHESDETSVKGIARRGRKGRILRKLKLVSKPGFLLGEGRGGEGRGGEGRGGEGRVVP